MSNYCRNIEKGDSSIGSARRYSLCRSLIRQINSCKHCPHPSLLSYRKDQKATKSQTRRQPSEAIYSPIFFNTNGKENLPEPDKKAVESWVYPTNFPVREYQFSIVQTALQHNTLVCLPTGLGKTLISAVVMHNFQRWFPTGQVVFLAPTKPLVSQQVEACHKVTGLSLSEVSEMTGQISASRRSLEWTRKRIFFVTPQVLVNDLKSGRCDGTRIVCVIFDEAHKAQGNHAYCKAIKRIASKTCRFRVVGLSATPGSAGN